MRKLGWFAVSAAVASMIVFGVALLIANLYVQSEGVQQRIRQTLSDALRMPVSLKKTTLTPWEGLRLDGIALLPAASPDAEPSTDDALMTVDSFRLRAAWWPLLFQRRVVIEGILLDHPRIAWAQNNEGRWVWPEEPSAAGQRKGSAGAKPEQTDETPPTGGSSTGTAPAVPTPATIAAADAKDEAARPLSASLAQPVVAVERIRVRHGALDLLTKHRKLLGRFEEVDLDGKLQDAGHATGEFRVQNAMLARSGLRLTNFRSGFSYDEAKGLSIDHGTGDLAGGELHANYRLRTQETGSPFSAECHVDNVDLSQLLKEAGSELRLIEGRLQGGVAVEGVSDDPERRHASGELKLVGAHVRNFPLLQLLGDLLHIEDLSHLQFKQAEMSCKMAGNDLRIESLDLASNDLHILAQGAYAAGEDELSLRGRLTIDRAISHQLPQYIEMNFTPCGDAAPGCRYIDFDVTGPLNKPSTNLFDRVLAGPNNSLLQNLLAPKPKKSHPKAAKGNEPAPPPAPIQEGDKR